MSVLTEVMFLGQVIDSEGIRPDPKKVMGIQRVPAPTNVGDLRCFLGMANQLSKFLQTLSTLWELSIKGNAWVWGEPQRSAFQIKGTLVTSPVLALFDPNLETVVSANASSYSLGGSPLAKTALWRAQASSICLQIDITPTKMR